MVNLDIVHASNTKLVHSHPLVAVFVGGTSGIGEYTLRALAATHGKDGKGLRAYIVGRKAAAAEKTIAHCASICPKGQFLFVKAGDLSLMKDVDRVCAEITQLEKKESAKNGEKARIDVLVMSQHYFPLLFEPRKGTYLVYWFRYFFFFALECLFHYSERTFYMKQNHAKPFAQTPPKVSTPLSPCFTTPASVQPKTCSPYSHPPPSPPAPALSPSTPPAKKPACTLRISHSAIPNCTTYPMSAHMSFT